MRFFHQIDRMVRTARAALAPLVYHGDAFHCPACGKSARRFKPAGKGKKARDNAVCPYCRARERDRMVMLFLQKHPELFPVDPPHFLHVAPEPSIRNPLRKMAGSAYLSADIYHPDVMEKMDITAINRPDGFFGAVFCSHVLQDIADDDQALRELFRVLAPGGWAVINVPYRHGTKTTALDAIDKGGGRPREFFRDYGEDYKQQLERAGFIVTEIGPLDLCDAAKAKFHAIDHAKAGLIHFCRKPPAG